MDVAEDVSRQCVGTTARNQGALGVLLAKQLRAKLGIPIGIIQVCPRHLAHLPSPSYLGRHCFSLSTVC